MPERQSKTATREGVPATLDDVLGEIHAHRAEFAQLEAAVGAISRLLTKIEELLAPGGGADVIARLTRVEGLVEKTETRTRRIEAATVADEEGTPALWKSTRDVREAVAGKDPTDSVLARTKEIREAVAGRDPTDSILATAKEIHGAVAGADGKEPVLPYIRAIRRAVGDDELKQTVLLEAQAARKAVTASSEADTQTLFDKATAIRDTLGSRGPDQSSLYEVITRELQLDDVATVRKLLTNIDKVTTQHTGSLDLVAKAVGATKPPTAYDLISRVHSALNTANHVPHPVPLPY